MNYIKELQQDREVLLRALVAAGDGMQAFMNHTLTSKFRDDTTIQTQDVRNWLEYIRMEIDKELYGLSSRKVKHD